MAVYRLGRFVKGFTGGRRILLIPLIIVFKIMNYMIKFIHHVYIHGSIGPGFYIGHVGDIHIGPISIGSNFSITHNVTIGIGYKDGLPLLPKSIGDNVWIGTGSVISGPVTIGNGTTIASGSILSKDVSDGCLAMGNPARVIMQNYDNSHLFGKTIEE